jgi:hypothetical protein
MKNVWLMSIVAFWIVSVSAISFAEKYYYDPRTEDPSAPSQRYEESTIPPGGSAYPDSGQGYPQDAYASTVKPKASTPLPRYIVEINGNSSSFEGRFSHRWPYPPTNSVLLGVNAVLGDNNFYDFNVDLVFGSKVTERFNLDIGLKAIWGHSELYNDNYDLGALAFIARAQYFTQGFDIGSDFNISLDLFGEICGAPSALTFSDGSQYIEWRAGVDINLVESKRTAIVLAYRYIQMTFEGDLLGEWDEVEDGAYIGFKIRF